jgi:hypothetical protein
MFGVAGFRPGRRGPFVPAKGPKTSDAPSGLIRADGLQPEECGPTRGTRVLLSLLEGLTQGPPADESVPSWGQTAGVGAWTTLRRSFYIPDNPLNDNAAIEQSLFDHSVVTFRNCEHLL